MSSSPDKMRYHRERSQAELTSYHPRSPLNDSLNSTAMLCGRRVSLRPVRPEDYSFHYELAISQGFSYRWTRGNPFPAYERFCDTLRSEPNAQFSVIRSQGLEIVGLAVAYDVDVANGTASAGIIMSEPLVGSGLGVEAAALFANYLFNVWNFRKIYAQAPEYTVSSYRSAIGPIFKEEGILRKHRFHRGRFWDEHILAIYKEDWKHLASRILPQDRDANDPPSKEN